MQIKQTQTFKKWIDSLRDQKAVCTIRIRIVRLEAGLLGDVKALGAGLLELRIDLGPGYRLYFSRQGDVLIWLLCGGDKSTQSRDIEKARQILAELKET